MKSSSKLRVLSLVVLLVGTFFGSIVHNSAYPATTDDKSSLDNHPIRNDDWKKSFLPGFNININPYDPIARVTGAEFWKRIFYKHPSASQLFQSGNPNLETISLYNLMKPNYGFHFVNQGVHPTTQKPTTPTTVMTTTGEPTIHPPTIPMTSMHYMNATINPMPGQMPSMDQMHAAGQMPSTSHMPMTGQMPSMGQMPSTGHMPMTGQMPSPSQMPSTDQLINCIDWLLEWLQTNSTPPLRSHPYVHRNRNRNKFNYN